VESVCEELSTDSHRFIGRKCPRLAGRIAADFPSPQVIDLYTNPLVSDEPKLATLQLHPRQADVKQLACICHRLFSFGREGPRKLQDVFRDVVWPGLGIQLVVHEALFRDGSCDEASNPGEFSTIDYSIIPAAFN